MSSNNAGKAEAVKWIKENFKSGETCLDVGAGDGKWADLLDGYLQIYGVEVFNGNIINNNLPEKYNRIYNADIRTFNYKYFDLIIFGDVIEHMRTPEAQNVIKYAWDRCRNMIIAVPFRYRQGAIYGNPYEKHIQDDLTPEIFNIRYPGFMPIFINDNYAYYIKKLGRLDHGR